jgi:exo-beta-1,3-glucanase (GH17 family)
LQSTILYDKCLPLVVGPRQKAALTSVVVGNEAIYRNELSIAHLVENIQTSPEWKSYAAGPQIVTGEDSHSDLIGGMSDLHHEKSIDRRFANYYDYV